jgi:membrane protease YdiL (CAAX protease family)
LTVPLVWLFIYAGVMASGWLAQPLGLQVSAGSGRWQDNIAALFASGPVLLIFWLWLRFYEGRRLEAAGLDRFNGRRFGAGFLTGVILVAVVVAAGFGLGGYQVNGLGAWYDHLTPTWLLASVLAIAGTVVQATVTETLFRGWMLGTVARQWGGVAAVAVNLLAVALIQGGNAFHGLEAMIGAVNFVLMAWFLSLNALRDGTLWGVCGFHAAWNLTMGWGLGLNVDTGHLNVTPALLNMGWVYEAPVWLTGGDFGPDGSALMTVAILVALLGWASRGMRLKGSYGGKARSFTGDELIDH